MESSRAFDVPQSLAPEVEKRLLRVFCFLRQHERKARVARKVAELQKLRCASALEPDEKRFQFCEEADDREPDRDEIQAVGISAVSVEAAVLFDQSNLLDELNLLSPADSRSKIKLRAAGSESRTPSNNNASVSTTISTISTAPHHEKEKHDYVLELSREIRELQKGILRVSLSCTNVPGCITVGDILSTMKAMNRSATKVCTGNFESTSELFLLHKTVDLLEISQTEAQWMVWEADDDLDGCVDWLEFRSSYARSLVDKHGLEPNQLYHFIQFLLCDTDESFTVLGACVRPSRAHANETKQKMRIQIPSELTPLNQRNFDSTGD